MFTKRVVDHCADTVLAVDVSKARDDSQSSEEDVRQELDVVRRVLQAVPPSLIAGS